MKISINFVTKDPSNNIPSPGRRQAIIWTNNGYSTDAYKRHSATMCYLNNTISEKDAWTTSC